MMCLFGPFPFFHSSYLHSYLAYWELGSIVILSTLAFLQSMMEYVYVVDRSSLRRDVCRLHFSCKILITFHV
ncbi:hypothetical protein BO85DRAFT_296353 [Aspergillus piperis CBS 112811]|uniref:Uncharacterized protein n=1 Tax=Aspergillus piperis CBS 112811 TaxID=1448313 RepID=A0A8G1VN26_9EURO|nr:hypothetical protein BO85DRAFT_296353 [Aspergillus piperis CBS 112811]RAH58147.1 hypothetical protein BO85DRAFT_296353 [Aspergillus piperis CBS 112811]